MMRTPWIAPLFAALAGCQSPTQLIVLIDTDLEVPRELAAVQAIIYDAEGTAVGSDFFDLVEFGVPMSFGIEGGALKDEQIRILIQGLTGTDELLIERNVVIEFIEGEQRLLPIFLARACLSMECGGDRTCSENGCVPVFIDVNTLPLVEPGEEGAFDAGVRNDRDGGEIKLDGGVGSDAGPRDAAPDDDAGTDAGRDAGRDAGPDAGSETCESVADCPFDRLCVDSIGDDCDGTVTCECRLDCIPFLLASDCPTGQSCYARFLDDDGVCLDSDLSTSANQRAACSSQADCDRFENFYCRQIGTNPGECTSLCLPPDKGFCSATVPGTLCATNPFDAVGQCLEPAPTITDIGASCMDNGACQSGSCLPQVSICSASCTGLAECPLGSLCALSFAPDDAWCVPYCTEDLDCTTNPEFVCREDIGPPSVCFYRCDSPIYPCPAGFTCDGDTGHCF